MFGNPIFGAELKWEESSSACPANTTITLSLPSAAATTTATTKVAISTAAAANEAAS
uniref:Uncharacterized protein n=1 Tax=Rhizophora mucronata TaxID=61149 RepID=A0A2P2IV10_RHIMU